MKKKLFAIALTAVLALGSAVSAFAGAPEGSSAYFSFDSTTDSATPVVKGNGGKVGEATTKEWEYVDGMADKALHVNPAKKDADGNDISDNIGLDTGVTVGSKAFTVSFWVKANSCLFATPLVWVGGADQTTEHWIGLWPGLNGDWTTGPLQVGTNSPETNRQAITLFPEGLQAYSFGWTHFTFSVEPKETTSHVAVYCNGTFIFESDNFALLTDDAKIYVGANAWDAPTDFEIDELAVFDKVLTGDEVSALYDTYSTGTTSDNNDENTDTDDKDDSKDDSKNDANSTDKDSDSKSNTTTIIIVVVVVVVIVAVVAVVASKKKKK